MHLTPQEVAERLRTTIGTLSNWRIKGYGPKYVKLGRRVLYPVREVEAFERLNTRASTSQTPAH